MSKPAEGNGARGAGRKAQVCCAVYTRKSSEEGLEQDFNSLDAQREACEAYIRSQRSEGWVCLPTLYDDPGFSGGTLERPALKRLLADIDAGAIDAVVVYKVDRLTRSLADFAKIVEVFDAKGVSFVSVTQQFNTTTSMGRLTLNMLLSFAQFEREVTGERIRDKIAASKARGMWMGGLPPLGYDVRDRKLVVNGEEAKTVRHIYSRYAELGSVLALKNELDQEGVRSKSRVDRFGRTSGSKPLARGALYLMLQNRIYRGEIVHKSKSYAGEHEAIVEQGLWDTVQAKLIENRVARRIGSAAEAPSLLAGLLVDSTGERMSPSHTRNAKGTRYRYYISQSLIKGHRGTAPQGRRVPAREVEELIEKRLQAFLRSEAEVIDALGQEGENVTEITDGARELAERWPELPPSEKRRLLLTLIAQVRLLPASLEISFLPERLTSLLGHTSRLADRSGAPNPTSVPVAQVAQDARESHPQSDVRVLTWSIPARLKRAGIEKRMLIEGAESSARRKPDLELTRFRGHFSMLIEREVHDAPQSRCIPAGVPAEDGRAGACWPRSRAACQGV